MAKENNTIIAFAGRMRCGKSTLANVTEKYGYERVSFATPLKGIVAHIMHVSIDDIARLKTANGEYTIDDDDCQFIANETGIGLGPIKELLQAHPWHNSRELLQVVGTDLIRRYNTDWHVNKLKEYILNSDNDHFVFDDLRFNNERLMVESLGGDCWFVVRPYVDEISNHISETALHWNEFMNIIITNGDAEYLTFNWNVFMKNGYEDSLNKRNELIKEILTSPRAKTTLINESKLFTLADSLFVSKHEYTYRDKFKSGIPFKIDKCNGFLMVQMRENESKETVTNPLEMEDLKIYLD